MIGYIVGGALVAAAVITGIAYHETHKVQPGNLSYGPGMYGLDAGIPPEIAVGVYTATQVATDPAQLRDFAQKTRELGYPLAAHALDVKADYLDKHHPQPKAA